MPRAECAAARCGAVSGNSRELRPIADAGAQELNAADELWNAVLLVERQSDWTLQRLLLK